MKRLSYIRNVYPVYRHKVLVDGGSRDENKSGNENDSGKNENDNGNQNDSGNENPRPLLAPPTRANLKSLLGTVVSKWIPTVA
jgi:hypothetical protein